MLWSENILDFFSHLKIKSRLPKGVITLNPYRDKQVFNLCQKFYDKYYGDSNPRNFIIGINPGRLGAGLTGIPFTDPIKLEAICDIPNDLKKKHELSSDFIYEIINSFGGPEAFYSKFYFGSISPLGFIKNGKNLNYYDIPELQTALIPFIKESLTRQVDWGLKREICFVLGEGKNFAFVKKLNDELRLFNSIKPLSHPRFIMQYKRQQLGRFIQEYSRVLSL